MKQLKLTLLLTVFLCMVGIKATAFVTSGKCGANLTWHYDQSTLTLTISGTGAMNHYDVHDGIYPPWYYDNIYQEFEVEQPSWE